MLAIAVIFYYAFGLEVQLKFSGRYTVSLNLVIDNFGCDERPLSAAWKPQAFYVRTGGYVDYNGALVIIFFLDEEDTPELAGFCCGSDY